MSKQLSGDITTSTFIRFWLVILGFLGVFGLLYLARNAIILTVISAFLAIALNPPVSAIAKRLPGKSRVGATALAYIIVVLTLTGFIITVVPTVIEQMIRFFKTLPGVIEGVSQQAHWLTDLISRYGLEQQYNQVLENIQNQAGKAASDLGGSFLGSVGSVVEGFITTLLLLVLTFLMLVEGPTWMKRLWSLYKNPERRAHHRQLIHKMYRVVTGYVNGQVLISAISAVCSLVIIVILSALFDMPANLAIPIAVIVFIAGLIPMFGATIGAIIAGVLLAINDVGAAVIFLIYYFIYQQIENNFVSPVVQSRAVEISALTVLVALTIGLSLFGILGGIISIPIAGCLRVLALDYLERNQAKEDSATTKKAVAKK